MNLWFALLRLEGLRQLRQPLPLLALLLVGLIGAPLSAIQFVKWSQTSDAESAIDQALYAELPIAADAVFASWVTEDDGLRVREGTVDEDGEVADDEVLLRVTLDGREAKLDVGPTNARSKQAERRIRDVLARQTRVAREVAMRELGLNPDTVIWDVQIKTHEAASAAGSPLVAFGIPMLLTLLITTAAMYAAFDAVLSEKLNHTAETLLTTRASRTAIAAAKSTNVLGMCMVVSTSLVLSLGIVAAAGWLDPVGQQLSMVMCLAAWVLALAIAAQLSAWAVTAAAWCDDYQTAGLIAVPLLLVPSSLASIAMLPGAKLAWWTALIPVANVTLFFRDLVLGEPSFVALVGVFAATVVHVAVAWRLAAVLLADPATITGRASPEGRRGLGRFGPDAFVTFAAAMVFLWFIGSIAFQASTFAGILVSQLGFAAVAIGAPAFFGMPYARMRLVPPPVLDAAMAVGLGLVTPWLAIALFAAQEYALPGGSTFAEQLGESLQLPDVGLVGMLALVALMPAVCEELLFRGTLLGMLEKDSTPVQRVVLVALLFALMHLSVYRILPTALIGLVAGFLVLRSRSLGSGMLFHFTHNAVVLGLASWQSGADGLG